MVRLIYAGLKLFSTSELTQMMLLLSKAPIFFHDGGHMTYGDGDYAFSTS